MKKIILIGAGGHAKSCIDVIESTKQYKIQCLLEKKIGNELFRYQKIIYDKKNLTEIRKKIKFAFISFGQITKKYDRQKTYNDLKNLGYKLPIIKSKTAYVSKTANILDGSIIMHRSVINTDVKIGYNNIINTGSIIEHDVSIGNHNHIAPGAVINGGVKIGNNCFIGSGSIIRQGIVIKNNSFIQAGKVILKNF
tara:strand:- start:1114 stop:1698 length:585 start_codon:yes stop_codon:yes gene_type:complete